MTADERFEHIERGLAALVTLHADTQKSLKTLMDSIGGFVESSHAYVQSSNARMAELERNLDALIRAITMEHQNGKGKP